MKKHGFPWVALALGTLVAGCKGTCCPRAVESPPAPARTVAPTTVLNAGTTAPERPAPASAPFSSESKPEPTTVPPAAVAAPAPAPTAAPAPAPAPAPVPAAPAPPPPTPSAWPKDFAAFVARLHGDAASGRDPDLAVHADLLAALERDGLAATEECEITRVPALEEAARAKYGRGTGWATITTYLEPAADPDALRAVYLDFDRVPEWTGKPGTKTLGRDGDVVLGETDGIRKALGLSYGARWRFRARPLDRGDARLVISTMVPSDDTLNMLETHGILVVFPEGSGVRVVEAAATAVDFEVPPLLRGMAAGSALKEMQARVAGMRGHWREYLRVTR